MTLHRRRFLRHLAAAPMLAGGTLGLSQRGYGADIGGYRALVCVFLYGGLDNNDLLLPAGNAYSDFARIRESLLAEQGEARAPEFLLPLDSLQSTADGSRWALPPEMPATKALFDSGRAAVVANVGPLIEPVTRQQFLDETVRLPPRLFSHNDQQATWQASAPEGAQYGWGGLFADAFLRSGASAGAEAFATITATEVGPFLTGERAFPYRINPWGASQVYLLGENETLVEGDDSFEQRLLRHLRGDRYSGSHVIRSDMATALGKSLATNARYNSARGASVTLATPFPDNELGAQLRAVADTIAIRNELGVQRQIFFVGIGGFDTHSAQATDLPALLGMVDSAAGAFYQATEELGIAQDVTLFTASDFGRTLAINGDGTDHGWGGHHLVIGGGVNGGNLLGTPPPPRIDNPRDAGAGAAIPEFSVEQFAAPLGRWMGLSDAELDAALPALGNFDRNVLTLFT